MGGQGRDFCHYISFLVADNYGHEDPQVRLAALKELVTRLNVWQHQ